MAPRIVFDNQEWLVNNWLNLGNRATLDYRNSSSSNTSGTQRIYSQPVRSVGDSGADVSSKLYQVQSMLIQVALQVDNVFHFL